MGRRSRSTKLVSFFVMLALAQSMCIVSEPAGDEPREAEEDPVVRWTVEVADPTNETGRESTLALDGQDRPHMAHFDFGNVSLRYTTKVGGAWTTEVVDDSDLVGEFPSIAIDSQDRVHISYAPRQPLYHFPEDPPPPEPMTKALRYAVQTDGGWEKHVVWGPWAGYTSLALDSNDQPHISYSDWNTGSIHYATHDGVGWHHEEVDSEGFLDNAIAVDSEGNPHIAYARYAYGCMELYYAKWNGSWQKEKIGLGGVILTDIGLAIDEFDRRHLIWDGKDGMRYAIWNGSWAIQDIGSFHTSLLAIALQDNSPRMFYESSQDKYGIYEGGEWKWETINTTERAGIGITASHPLAIDDSGVPHYSAIGVFGRTSCLVYVSRDPLPAGPLANAGPDQTVNEGEVVQFDGTDSGVPGELSFELTEPARINNVSTDDQRGMSIAKNSQGHILVAWRDDRDPGHADIYFAKSVNGGLSFEGNVKVGEDIPLHYFPSEPRMAVDSEDNIYLVWRSWSESGDNTSILLSRSMDEGLTFDGPRLVNDPALMNVPRSIPSIAIGKNDTLHISWHEVPAQDEQICVATSADRGESFGPCVVASSPTGGGANWGSHQMTSLAADSEGHVYVAWRSHHYNNVGRDDIFVSRSVDGGISFETQIKVSDWDKGTNRGNFWPTILAGPQGTVYVVWLDGRDATPKCFAGCDVYFSRSTDYGETFEPNVRVNDNSSEIGFQFPSMTLDSEGNPYVAWTTYPEGIIFFDRSTDMGETFGEDLGLLVNQSNHLAYLGSITLTDDGTLHVAWNLDEEEIHVYPYLYDVYYSHSLTSVTSGNLTYEWDFDAGVDTDRNGNFTDDTDASGPMPTWTYGDDGVFTVTLKVTDDLGNWDTDTMNVTVLNVAPDVSADYLCSGGSTADIMFRIAGEKWHDVIFVVLEDGNEIYNETLVRMPGSPNKQMIGLEGFAMNGSRSYSVIAYYTPEDDPVNGQTWGATPAWIILRSGGNETARLHHTFNVRHPDTWVWRVDDLESYMPSRECTFTATTSDPGSDDLTFAWDFGDGGIAEHMYFNDGIGPDSHPSPEVNPITVTDTAKHAYASAGTYTVTLTVRDDDGGVVTQTTVLDLS